VRDEVFRCIGDIPGLDYRTDSRINRAVLPGVDSYPEVRRYMSEDGTLKESYWWPNGDGLSGAPPARRWMNEIRSSDLPTEALQQRLYESLELPGAASDYHFSIQGTVDTLWARRRDEPEVRTSIEELAWLDIRLIQAHPAAVTYESADGPSFFGITTFGRLVYLYEREGAWRDALAVSDLAFQFNMPIDREMLVERVAALDAEVSP
jgi:hypothetical protein